MARSPADSRSAAAYPTPLPVTPEPDESARGFLLRVADRNLCSTDDIADWIGLPSPGAPLDVDPAPAAKLLGIEPERLARMGFEDEEGSWMLGHKLPPERLYRTQRFFCPDCLAEKPYYRRIWEVRQLDVCPKHSRQLMGHCPECGIQIRWVSQWYDAVCNCGCSLDRPGTSPLVEDCVGAGAVYLHCGLPLEGEIRRLPSVFRDMPLASLLDLLFFLGRMQVVVAAGNPDALKPREMETDRGILNAGTRIALGWPGSFEGLANGVRAARPGRNGIMRQYGYLHRFIMRSKEPYSGLLRSAYANHLAARDDVPERSWPVGLPHEGLPVQALTPLEAQLALGLKRNSFSSLRKQPLWTDIQPLMVTRNRIAQYLRSDVEALGRKLSRMVSPGVADRTLGLGKGRTNLLIGAGLVEVYQWNRHHRNSEQRSVDLADLEALFDRVRRLAVDAVPTRPVTFETLLVMAVARRTVFYLDVVRCLLAGQLRGHLTSPWLAGLASLTFEKTDAEDMMRRLACPGRTGKMVLGQVKRQLGIPAKAIHQLVEEGFLPQPERVCAFIFDVAAIEAFQNQFTYDFALARQRKASVCEIQQALALIGIRPATTITMVNGMKVGVYRMHELGSLS